ncbi:MAG: hypothetical protein IJR21_07910 [Synergistaceae bacterium]|nr:hypothetical protein [Synergistaceae bacterium]
MRHYIPETLRVSAVLYRRIRDLTRKIVWTRSYYNSLNNLMTGKTLQDSWEKEFETDVVTKVDTGLNYICEDIDRVNDYYNKADKLYNKYQALAQRYNFYCYFKRIKQGTSSPSWSDSKTHDYATVFTRDFRL